MGDGDGSKPVDLDKMDLGVESLARTAARVSEGLADSPGMKAIRKSAEAGKMFGASQSVVDQISAASEHFKSLTEGIGRQKSLLDQLRSPNLTWPSLLEPERVSTLSLELPQNPVFETNARLERIEGRFEEMHQVAINAAQIATDLQAYAANFLAKFEVAAKDTNRGARRAVWVGLVAIFIAVVTPILQIAYESQSERQLTASTKAQIELLREQARIDLQTYKASAELEIANLRSEIEALRVSSAKADDESTTILRDILDRLQPAPIVSSD